MESKILVCDIEWSPATAYVWKMFDENVSPAQLIDPGGLLWLLLALGRNQGVRIYV